MLSELRFDITQMPTSENQSATSLSEGAERMAASFQFWHGSMPSTPRAGRDEDSASGALRAGRSGATQTHLRSWIHAKAERGRDIPVGPYASRCQSPKAFGPWSRPKSLRGAPACGTACQKRSTHLTADPTSNRCSNCVRCKHSLPCTHCEAYYGRI
jgi:hypothetical protein